MNEDVSDGQHLQETQLRTLVARQESETTSHELDAALRHLAGCEECRDRLNSLAADQEFWQQSADVLRGLETEEEDIASDVPEGMTLSDERDDATVMIVRSILSPSEVPESLGRLSRFEVLGIVGAGGMGIVLKARDVDIQRVVALKIPAPHLWRSPTALATLEREARSAATIVHPHVISIYQIDRWRNIPFLVMPYYLGGSLDRLVAKHGGPLPLSDAIRITRQLAEALAAAHDQGVIHRDIKPGNVLLHRSLGRAVLCDFGLAKVQHDATLTASGFFAGTPSYLSPEQARGETLGPASDLYCLGSVLWTMLTGEIPWHGEHPHAITRKIADGQFPEKFQKGKRTVSETVPGWVLPIERRLHAVAPEDRYASAQQLVELLRACEKHLAEPKEFPIPKELMEATEAKTATVLQRTALRPLLTLLLVTCLAVWLAPWAINRGSVQPGRNHTLPVIPKELAAPVRSNESELDQLEAMLDNTQADVDQLLSELKTIQQTAAPESLP